MRPTWARPIALLMILLLAGCGSKPGNLDPTTSPTTSAPTSTTTTSTPTPCLSCPDNRTLARHETAAFLECAATYNSIAVEKDKLQALLPTGYTVDWATPVVTMGAEYESCNALVLDNTTVIKPLSFLAAAVAVVPPSRLASSHTDAYLFEWLLSNATAVEWLRAAGFPAKLAEFSTSTGADGFPVLLVVAEGSRYELRPQVPRTSDQMPIVQEHRRHSVGSRGACHADTYSNEVQNEAPGPVTGSASGGLLGTVLPQGQIVGQSALATREIISLKFECPTS